MKKTLLISLLMFLFVVNLVRGESNIEYLPQDQPPSILELAFLRELGLPILDAMASHGNPQLFTSARIEKVQRNIEQDYFDITLRVVGYEGPINPPYKLIRITFRVPAGDYKNRLKVISYKATNITPEEFVKLSEFTR